MAREFEWLDRDVDDFFDRLEELIQESKTPFELIYIVLTIEKFDEDDVDEVLDRQTILLTHYLVNDRLPQSPIPLQLERISQINTLLGANYEYLGFRDDCRGGVVCGLAL